MKTMKTVLLILAILAICSSVVSAKTWHIKPDGTGDVPTIQAGVDTAASGDTLLLASGTFTGAGNKNVWIEYKNVSVISEAGATSTTIDCEGTHNAFTLGLDVTNSTVVSGLTIENGYGSYWGGAINCHYGASPRIENNVIQNCMSDWIGGGICVTSNSNPIIQNNLITGCTAEEGGGVYLSRNWSTLWFAFNTLAGNTATESGGGMHLTNSWPTIYNNTIYDNDAPLGAGIFLTEEDSHPTIDNTIIAFNTTGEGIVCSLGALPLLECCDIYGNAGGDALCGQDGGNNFCADPEFCGTTGNGGNWLWDTSPCAIAHSPCAMFVGAWPVGCQATGIGDEIARPTDLRLMPNFPNPFNPTTTITFETSLGGWVTLAVYDASGSLVTTLVDEIRSPGIYHEQWDGRDRRRHGVSSGVYFFRLATGEQTLTRKAILLK
jgi:parallel beta-helix repeat protein